MSTIAQVKKLTKPILAGHPDLVLIKRLVIVRPVRHILRFVCVDQSSGKDGFYPSWSMMMLFRYDAFISLNHYGGMYDKGFGHWIATKPGADLALCAVVEQTALPILRSVETIGEFVAFHNKERFRDTYLDLYPARKIYADVALGNRAAALAHCAYFATDHASRRYSQLMQDDLDVIQQRLCPMILSDDVAGLAAFLHEMEDITVKRHKLEHLWERTPFPLEECGWI